MRICMDSTYEEVMHRFFFVLRELKRDHHMYMHSHFDLYKAGLIEVWEDGNHCICKVQEKDDTECYRRAAEILESYQRKEERRKDERKTG